MLLEFHTTILGGISKGFGNAFIRVAVFINDERVLLRATELWGQRMAKKLGNRQIRSYRIFKFDDCRKRVASYAA